MTISPPKPLQMPSLSNIRERYGDDVFDESAAILRDYVPYFDPDHDSYYYVFHYLELIASILDAGQDLLIQELGETVCDSCGGLGITSRGSYGAVCVHCRGQGSIIKIEISHE